MNKTIETFRKIYRERVYYDQKYNEDIFVLDYMKDCKHILDVGCGEGRFISHNPKKIMGIDQNQQSLKICKDKGFNVIYGKVTKLPFKDSSFDAVHCSHVIEHLLPEGAYKLLREMNRVLKKGGILCLRTPLLYKGFYCDFTHIKPYYPEAILHYLKTSEQSQRTLQDIEGEYKLIRLKYRRAQLFLGFHTMFLDVFFNFLYRLGISSFKKTGYVLILRKI